MCFTFQRKKYECVDGRIRKIRFPSKLRIREYAMSAGLSNAAHVADVFGGNDFDLPAPAFWPCFKQQLMAYPYPQPQS